MHRAISFALLGVVFSSACTGSQVTTYTAEEQLTNRAHFDLFAAGTFATGNGSVVAVCAPALAPQQAYPGIAVDARWDDVVAIQLSELREVQGNLDGLTDKLILVERAFEVGQEIKDNYWSVAPYSGATLPGVDAEFTCGSETVSSESALRLLYRSTVSFEREYGLDESAVFDAVEAAQASVTSLTATQESFLLPFGAADDVVGLWRGRHHRFFSQKALEPRRRKPPSL